MKNKNIVVKQRFINLLSLKGEGGQRPGEGALTKICSVLFSSFALRAFSPSRRKEAFTLIELLVVVLIIGILAAVAVPQYQIAVAKSRTASALSIAKSLAAAEEAYYLQNGEYINDVNLLDVETPNCSFVDGYKFILACDDYTQIGLDYWGSVNILYCPKYTTSYSGCNTNTEYSIGLRLAHYRRTEQAGKNLCFPAANSKLGQIICSSFGLQQL